MSGADRPPRPEEVISAWVEAFNAADPDRLAARYALDAINHQMPEDPVRGRDAIRSMFAAEFQRAEMVCIPIQMLVDGEWVALEWKDPLGMRGCGFFRVVEGRIVTQRGYWDKLSFAKLHGLPIPSP